MSYHYFASVVVIAVVTIAIHIDYGFFLIGRKLIFFVSVAVFDELT